MRTLLRSTSLALVSLLALGSAAAAPEATHPTTTFFEEAKISVNDRAHADGYLRVRITPENGQGREATIVTAKHMSENDIAKTLAAALKTAVAPDFEVDRDAGEHVKIRKAKKGTPNFSVEITFSSPGFSIVLDN
jgi:hypothetical protein